MQVSEANNSHLNECLSSGWEEEETGVAQNRMTGCWIGDHALIGVESRAG